ncbi:MAG TPA: glycosyl hydrolase, partial [Terriglobales bacterium]|nr:glycosyl hydrolase [Terriglobales bacterium]
RKGLPEGDLGRIGLAPAPSRPSTIYAVVEAKETALYRSDDLGQNWTKMNTSFNVQGRPFYFAYVVVDPNDYQRVYKPGYGLTVSDDGGKTFGVSGESYHGDLHALWVNPKDSYQLLLGTDGGVYSSSDRGAHWRMLAALPVSQFYHVTYDMQEPYNVYGGLQDNGTWTGPSKHTDGIPNRAWRNLAFGDGFAAQVDQADPDYVYVEFQGGHVFRVRLSNGENKNIRPFAKAGEPELRFNWNTPLLTRPGRTGALYIGSQYLYRSTDRGDSWTRISPDLTTNNPEEQKQDESGGLTRDNTDAEKHCTIITISESPKNAGVIWVGTDDGNIQVTRDGGKNWTNVTKNLPGIPAETWVSTVEASHFEEGTAYASLDGHQTGDMKTYLLRTRDFGKTWEEMATPDMTGFAHVIREDLVNPSLLFAGTEMGLYISVDGGKSWAKFVGGMPKSVPVRDLAIHPREGDLIIATHGRGIYILDDLTALRALTPEVLNKDFAMLPSRNGVQSMFVFEQRFDGDGEFTGNTGRTAARIAYYLKKRMLVGDFKAAVYDAKGNLIEDLSTSRRKGINVADWSMRMKSPKTPPALALVPDPNTFFGPYLPEGTYTVKITRGKETATAEIHVGPDPRTKHSAADRAEQFKIVVEAYHLVEHNAFVVDAAKDLSTQAADRAGKLGADDPLRKNLQSLQDSLAAIQRKLAANKEGGYTGEIELREKILEVYGGINGYAGKPTESQIAQLASLRKQLDDVEADYRSSGEKALASANPELAKKKLPPLKLLTEEEWRKKSEEKGGGGMLIDADHAEDLKQLVYFLHVR